MSYRIVPIPTSIAEAVRTTGESPFERHPTHTQVARGHGPCRHCLRTFVIGREQRILFTYDPFAGVEELPLPGPIFIHAEPCSRYPEDGGIPADLENYPLTLNAYARGRALRGQEYMTTPDVDAAIARLLRRTDIDYIHVRDTASGCFDFRVERLRE